jgi:acyl-CoA thioesterase II
MKVMTHSESTTLQALLERLELEQLDRDLFLGSPGKGDGRLFGGMVAAQAVMAAGRTVDHGFIHSLHAYFLRPGNHTAPIRYAVYRIRDGRTFTSRDVVAYQGGEAIFSISTSFAVPEEGASHQEPIPAYPGPDGLPDVRDVLEEREGERPHWLRSDPIEQRHIYPPADGPPPGELPRRAVWIRPKGELPEDPLVHTAVMVYASDRGLLGTVAFIHGRRRDRAMSASLDHAMWFHRLPRFDDWLLFTSESPVAHAARALIHGAMHTRDGVRMASVTQEGLVRARRD